MDSELEEKRARAKRNVPKLQQLLRDNLKATNDEDFTVWAVEVLDMYMMHECKLGNIPGGR